MSGFGSFDDFLAVSRVDGLALSPDGSRLVAAVSELNEDGDKFVSSLWELDQAGNGAPRRLTRSTKGERSPVFVPDGSLLFTSGRDADDDEPPALWRLPAIGEAARVLKRPGGVNALSAALSSGTVVVATKAYAGHVRRRNGPDQAHGAQGQEDHRCAAHRVAGAVLGSRPRPRSGAAARAA